MIVQFRGSVRKILITLILRWLGIRKFSLSEGIRTSAQHYFSSRVTANNFLHPFLTRLHAMMTEDPWVCIKLYLKHRRQLHRQEFPYVLLFQDYNFVLKKNQKMFCIPPGVSLYLTVQALLQCWLLPLVPYT